MQRSIHTPIREAGRSLKSRNVGRTAIAIGAVAIAAAGVLTGCASNNSSAGTGQPITLTANVWSDWKFVQSAGDEFKKTHPNVTLKLNAITDGTYWTKIPGLFKTADTPDISAVPIDADHYPSFVKDGLLAPLDSAWESSGLNKNVSASVKQQYTQNGHQYAVSVGGVAVPVIYYNKDLFKKAGIADPNQTVVTMDEFYAISDKLKKAGIDPLAAGMGDGSAAYRYFAPVFSSMCGAPWEKKIASGDTSGWKDACVEKALQVVSDWKSKGIFAGGSSAGTAASSVAEATFSAGKSGMEMEGTWAVGALRQGNPSMNIGWFQMPIASGDSQKIVLSTVDSLAVSSGSKHVKEATEFLAFMANYAGIWQHGIPVRADLKAPTGTDPILTSLAKTLNSDGAAPYALEQVTKADLISTIDNAIVAVIAGQQSPSAAAGSIAAGA
ncbi:ABC transporter substrate-binding protein [Microbacterium sp. X-17]|uniref:ABC transporter substrate-binding protein n=1 Tax=Microbacterium sp. X-17 TaxID=3144404 RepID=UPI0031F484DA